MHANRLVHEKSPYLLQHAHNPVDWYPWGEEAFEKARSEDKPIFLSIGYSTCHWCHVMERESFENEAIAELLNRWFVPIKVDREERPDIDRIYMIVRAGDHGRRRLADVRLADAGSEAVRRRHLFSARKSLWPRGISARAGTHRGSMEERSREDHGIERGGHGAVACCRRQRRRAAAVAWIPRCWIRAFQQFRRSRSIRSWAASAARPNSRARPFTISCSATGSERAMRRRSTWWSTTLLAMEKGGMHDQLGGGFHRYSVDEYWFVPHFEKMLYDQAQLAISYLEAFQITQEDDAGSAPRGACSITCCAT